MFYVTNVTPKIDQKGPLINTVIRKENKNKHTIK